MKKICIKAVNVFLFMFIILTFSSLGKTAYASTLNASNNSIVKLTIEKENGNIVEKTGICVGKSGDISDKYIITTKTDLESKVKKVTTAFNGLEPIELTVKKISDKANMAALSVAAGTNGDFMPVKTGDASMLKVGETIRILGFSKDSDIKAQIRQTVISSTDIRGDFKSFSAAGEVDEVNYGAAVFDSKDNLVGMVVDPESSVSDRTDMVYINYISSVLSEDSYEKYKDNTQLYIIIAVAAAVVVAGIVGIAIAMGKKNKGKKLAKEVAPDDHSDGKTVAILPSASSKNGNGSQAGPGIVGVTGYFAGKKFAIPKHTIIGRDPKKVQIVFPDKTMGVSAVHCEIRNNAGALMLVDLGSTYGTFLQNGEKLQPSSPHLISPGEEFYLGTKDNRFKVTI